MRHLFEGISTGDPIVLPEGTRLFHASRVKPGESMSLPMRTGSFFALTKETAFAALWNKQVIDNKDDDEYANFVLEFVTQKPFEFVYHFPTKNGTIDEESCLQKQSTIGVFRWDFADLSHTIIEPFRQLYSNMCELCIHDQDIRNMRVIGFYSVDTSKMEPWLKEFQTLKNTLYKRSLYDRMYDHLDDDDKKYFEDIVSITTKSVQHQLDAHIFSGDFNESIQQYHELHDVSGDMILTYNALKWGVVEQVKQPEDEPPYYNISAPPLTAHGSHGATATTRMARTAGTPSGVQTQGPPTHARTARTA